ncbi:hypothetical protein ALC57_18790 [Trachymyrmex cornetzi]|uniref:Transposase Tc5 C-terminal domain-containing protein n=1 Tax=Trachymyrmex cornetzi TaxID=471704 RepID=A0A151IR06_9HYME|nr:hypothetical protein ALC57_18790 [Trachymyrmex cornetzi]
MDESLMNFHVEVIIETCIDSMARYIFSNYKYPWFKSGYTNKRPEEFENPIEFSFDKTSITCDIEGCSNIAVVKCLWCKKSLYLKHFFIEYHYYDEYE